MIKHFTEFEGRQTARARDEVRVSLNSKKVFVLNAKAFEALGSPVAVKFFFDEGRKVIGVRAAEWTDRNAFRLKPIRASRNQIIHAAPFCSHFRINVEGTVRFLNPEMDGEMLTLDITKTVRAGRGAK